MSGAGLRRWGSVEGTPVPQGVTWLPEEDAYNFALYSKHAERVVLLLYGARDLVRPLLTRALDYHNHKTGRIWHVRVKRSEAIGARYYAYHVQGPPPRGREEWHQFDPDKVLFDPYARALHFPQGFDPAAAHGPGSNAGVAPLGLIDTPGSTRRHHTTRHHEADTILYELHVRGFTRGPGSGVPAEEQGTFLGLIRKIPYLRELGVTVVELMPVFQGDPLQGDYWGYMPLSFFAPRSAYARGGDPEAAIKEFRLMVDALHRAGIEVVLDVVYNHTGEGDQYGPTYSYRGIDSSTYYVMTGDPARPYLDLSGTGNTLHTANRYVRKMIVDSLRYWAEEMGVDGFRFDLAAVFARSPDGRLVPEDSGLFGDIVADPVLNRLRLIAEPWDASGVQLLGRGLPGLTWAQWNARFQEEVRRSVRGDAGMISALMTRLYGSADLFPDDLLNACRPPQSINYVTSHDGFTLYDLVSYETKRNWANGHDNLDGSDNNFSWNCGWEGDEGVPPDVLRLRLRQARNFMALLLLSNGLPMLRAGDEFLQTQGGNNNPYNQDNTTSWLDWSRLVQHRDFHRFVRLLIAFRKTHPSLCRSQFWRADVRWYGPDGPPETGPDAHCLALWLGGQREGDTDIYVMVNGGSAERSFTIQEGAPEVWRRVFDTGREPPYDVCEPGAEGHVNSAVYRVAARSIVLLLRMDRGA
jgi:isoamylase